MNTTTTASTHAEQWPPQSPRYCPCLECTADRANR